jgi:hypothetical protein
MINRAGLVSLCRILNKNHIEYAVAGGYACALNGHIRMTEDIDLLIKDTDENLNNVVKAIHEIFPDLNEKIAPNDIRDNVVLKIIDYMEIDFSIKAWNVTYSDAEHDIKHVMIDGIDIPYLGVDMLIRSKETMREIDQWDVKILREIIRK